MNGFDLEFLPTKNPCLYCSHWQLNAQMCQQIHIHIYLQFPHPDTHGMCNSIQWYNVSVGRGTYKYMKRSINKQILTSVVDRSMSFYAKPMNFLFTKSFFNFLNSLPILCYSVLCRQTCLTSNYIYVYIYICIYIYVICHVQNSWN